MRRRGITLTELLIVIAVLGILAGISTPVFTNALRRAKLKEVKATADLVASAARYYDLKYNGFSEILTEPTQSNRWTMLGLDMPVNGGSPSAQDYTVSYSIGSVGGDAGLIISTSTAGAWITLYTYDFVTRAGNISNGNADHVYVDNLDLPGT